MYIINIAREVQISYLAFNTSMLLPKNDLKNQFLYKSDKTMV